MKLSIITAFVLQAVIAIAAPTELVKDAVSRCLTLVIDKCWHVAKDTKPCSWSFSRLLCLWLLDDIATRLDVNNGASLIVKPLIGFSLFRFWEDSAESKAEGGSKVDLIVYSNGNSHSEHFGQTFDCCFLSSLCWFSKEINVNVPWSTVYVPFFLESVKGLLNLLISDNWYNPSWSALKPVFPFSMSNSHPLETITAMLFNMKQEQGYPGSHLKTPRFHFSPFCSNLFWRIPKQQCIKENIAYTAPLFRFKQCRNSSNFPSNLKLFEPPLKN